MGSFRMEVLEVPEVVVGSLGLGNLSVRLGLCRVDYKEKSVSLQGSHSV